MSSTDFITKATEDVLDQQTTIEGDPVKIGTDAYNEFIAKIKTEISKPKYATKTNEEIVEMVNTPQLVNETETITYPPRTNEIIEKAKNSLTLYTVHNGNMASAVNELVDKEIQEDPQQRGYATMTRTQAVLKMEEQFSKEITIKKMREPLSTRLANKIPYAPNTISLDDIVQAKK